MNLLEKIIFLHFQIACVLLYGQSSDLQTRGDGKYISIENYCGYYTSTRFYNYTQHRKESQFKNYSEGPFGKKIIFQKNTKSNFALDCNFSTTSMSYRTKAKEYPTNPSITNKKDSVNVFQDTYEFCVGLSYKITFYNRNNFQLYSSFTWGVWLIIKDDYREDNKYYYGENGRSFLPLPYTRIDVGCNYFFGKYIYLNANVGLPSPSIVRAGIGIRIPR